MPTIHVLYDPNDKVSGTSGDQMKLIGVSSVVMQINGPTIENIDTTITNCVEMLLEQIMDSK